MVQDFILGALARINIASNIVNVVGCSQVITGGDNVIIIIDEADMNRLQTGFCKRCKRHAHDEHESGSQQSQQTSFKVRFLHVNFSYSLKFI